MNAANSANTAIAAIAANAANAANSANTAIAANAANGVIGANGAHAANTHLGASFTFRTASRSLYVSYSDLRWPFPFIAARSLVFRA